MKKVLKTALVACAALTVLAGCSKEDNTVASNDQKSVNVKLTHAEATRAAGAHQASGAVAVNDGAIYFTTEGTTVVTMYNIVKGVDTDLSDFNVGIESLEAGVTFTNLPTTVKNVHVIANLPGGGYAVSDIAGFLANTYITIANQTDTKDVTLYGTNGLTANGKNTTTGNDLFTATFNVAPVVARFEVGKISASGSLNASASTIESFTVAGIYLDNHYKTMGIAGLAGDKYTGEVTPDNFVAANYPNMCDESGFTTSTDGEYPAYVPTYTLQTGETAAVWGYNLLAPASAQTPILVLKLTNVVIATGNTTTYGGTKFLTVKNIYDNGTKITTLAPGTIYRITNLQFAEGHLVANPNPSLIDIEVDVTLMPWVAKDVTYDFN